MTTNEPGPEAQTTEVAEPAPADAVNDRLDSAAAGTPRFRCLAGEEVGAAYPLSRLPVHIGRDPSSDICLRDPAVSRHHARVVREQDALILEDPGSSNGTLVDGHRIRRHPLRPGDRVQLGATLLAFGYVDDVERRVDALERFQVASTMGAMLARALDRSVAIVEIDLDALASINGTTSSSNDGPYRSSAMGPSAAERDMRIDSMRHAVDLLRLIARQLHDIGRPALPSGQAFCELAAIVDDVVAAMPAAPEVAVETHVSRPLAVRGHLGDLRQVVRNLVDNARDAMPHGGRLSITAREVLLRLADAHGLHLPVRGPFVELTVADSGTGMPPSTLARIFEPFFTTKAVAGAGLGLSTSLGIVRHLGGNMLVQSAPGDGTSVRVLVPAVGNHANDRRISEMLRRYDGRPSADVPLGRPSED